MSYHHLYLLSLYHYRSLSSSPSPSLLWSTTPLPSLLSIAGVTPSVSTSPLAVQYHAGDPLLLPLLSWSRNFTTDCPYFIRSVLSWIASALPTLGRLVAICNTLDSLFPRISGGLPMWDTYQNFQNKPKKEDNIGLAEAITKSILSTGRIDLQRKLFCSMQLIGGVALTSGLIPAVEERVLHAIPSNEAIDTVEVLPSRTNPSFVPWKGGAILGILDFGRDAWIHREDWVRSGIHLRSGRKYKDSYFLQAQAMCYINS